MGQWVFIEAEDVWMFRDSKPFTAQQAFNATSQFPPNPQTMQGVIRSHYLERKNINLAYYRDGKAGGIYNEIGPKPTQENGMTVISLGSLKIKGPYVARRVNGTVELLVPAPLDVVGNKKGYKLLQVGQKNFITDEIFDSLSPLYIDEDNDPTDPYKHREGWMTQAQFEAYLQGAEPRCLKSTGDIWQPDPRIGLALDYGKRANKESHLYRATFARPQDNVGLLVHVSNNLFEGNGGLLRIGGESRMGRYSVINNFTMPQPITKTGKLKVVVMTPAYFKKGWYPERGWSHWVGKDARLVSAVIGKPLAISGWDVAHNRPKPLRHYVPVGSVYYFEHAEWLGKPFTEYVSDEPRYDHVGFGCVAIGTYK